jgi:hypothetical protein
MIGAYGSEWVETPNLDRLAADGVLFDSAFCDERDLRSAVFGRLSRIPFVHIDQSEVSSDESVFAKAAETWDGLAAEDVLLWIDVALSVDSWIPPPEWRGRLREEDDPEPIYAYSTGPIATADVERLASGWADRMAYFDSTFGAFIQAIDEDAPVKPIVAFTGMCGEALGEHSVVGASKENVHRENVQRPFILRHPTGPRSARRAALLNSEDVAELIVDLAEGDSASRLGPRLDSERWCVANRSLTTRYWRVIENAEGDAKLFALPEDVCEMNDLASRAPGTVENLRTALAQFNLEANDGAG